MLVDIPWTMVDGDLNMQRLIFRKDNSLYIVKEGGIQESKWEYLAAMDSFVLEIGGKKILLNEVFADGKALILKKDGASMEFLALANQKELSDLNLIGYLKQNYNQINLENSGVRKDKFDPDGLWMFVVLIVLLITGLVFFDIIKFEIH